MTDNKKKQGRSAEDLAQQKGARRLLGHLIRQDAGYFVSAILLTVLVVLMNFVSPALLAEMLDHYLGDKPSRMPAFINQWMASVGGRDFVLNNLWVAGLSLVVVAVTVSMFSFLRGRLSGVGSENAARRLRDQMYRHIQSYPYLTLVNRETGDLIQRCTSDVDRVRRFLSQQLMQITNAVVMLVVALVLMIPLNWKITLVALSISPITFLFSLVFYKRVLAAFEVVDEAEGKMTAVLQENLTGIRVVRAFGQGQREVERFRGVSGAYKKLSYRQAWLESLFWSTSDLLSMLQVLITLAVCVVAAVRGSITLGDVIVFTSYSGMLVWPIRQLGRILSNAGKTMVALRRINEVLETPGEAPEAQATTPPLTGDIVFDNVSFRYDEKGPWVLENLSFTIKGGATLAILGATGSGKSTLVQLLQRLYEPTSGKITIGGVDIATIDRAYLRQHVGLILQEPFLYSRNIKENIALAVPEADDKVIDRAASDAMALPFILESEKGYDTIVGERGVTLSGGQKQRVAIARTLMKDNKVLIFDDSLSAVDTQTDSQIRQALATRGDKATTIIISHRVTTLSRADQILILEKGRLADLGTEQELLSREGLYKRVYDIQTGLFDQMDQTLTDKGEQHVVHA